MHVWSVLTTSFPAQLFWTSVPRIIDPEPRGASVLVLCLLTGPSEFVVDFVKILREVGHSEELEEQKNMGCFLMPACSSLAA